MTLRDPSSSVPNADRGMWALVPVKRFREAKTRLALVLDPEERAALAAAMLEDVLDALAAVSGLAGLLVVTSDPRAAACARARAARVVADPGGGLNAAVAFGLAVLGDYGAVGALVVPSDVPMTSGPEIEALMAAATGYPVALVPAASDSGTNALLLSLPSLLGPSFGPDSFRRHVAASHAAGVAPFISLQDGLSLDIDRPEDIGALLAHPRAGLTETGRLLAARVCARSDGREIRQMQERTRP